MRRDIFVSRAWRFSLITCAKSLISDWFCPAQSYPRSGEGSVFEMLFSTGRNPLVRHCHPPSSSQHSCGAGTCCLLRCPETSVQTVRLTGTRWDGKQRESRTGGIGKLGEPFQKAKSIKSLQLECTCSFSKTIQLAQEPSSSPQPCVNNGQYYWNFSSLLIVRSYKPLPCSQRNHTAQAAPFFRAEGSWSKEILEKMMKFNG